MNFKKTATVVVLVFSILFSSCGQTLMKAYLGVRKPKIEVPEKKLTHYYKDFINYEKGNVFVTKDSAFLSFDKVNLPLLIYVNGDSAFHLSCFDDLRYTAEELQQGKSVGKVDSVSQNWSVIKNNLEEYDYYNLKNAQAFESIDESEYIYIVWAYFLGNKLINKKYLKSLIETDIPIYIFNVETAVEEK